MRYASAGAFRAALEQRLLAIAGQGEVPLVRLRKLVVFDRLMARLTAVAPDRWILKGAVALQFRVGPRFRTTKDLDIGRYDDEQAATTDFQLVQSAELRDYFSFTIRRTGKLDALLEGAAVRYHIVAEVDGRPFEQVTVDVGFADMRAFRPEVLRGPDLLGFADIAPVEVPTIPLEQHVAEKFHAYSRSYAAGHSSSRAKDLIDLVLIASLFPLRAGDLVAALRATFDIRGSHPLPGALPPPPAGWGPAYRKLADELGLQPEVSAGHQQASAFLDPILGGAVSDAVRWDPARQTW